jgi:transcriptional regulator with XRE-family HTH domain
VPSEDVQQAKEAFGARLRELRMEASLTGRALARLTGLHYTKISRAENGRQSVTDAEIQAWCRACGASDQISELIVMARTVESMYREWRRQTRAGMRQLQESSAPLYERTRLFRIYEHTALPGLFHTAEYSMEVMSYWVRFLGLPDDAEAATAARLARQKVLRSGRRRFVVVLAEQALRTRLGTSQVMTAQLEHLLEVMRLPNVSVGIIPAMAERYTVVQVPFWIWDDVRVTVETVSARLEITRPDEIVLYGTVFDQLRQSAVYGSRARELISEAIADHNLQHSATT